VLDVGEGEGGQLGAAHRRGEAEQDQCGVPSAEGCAAVDVLDDLADLAGPERPRLAAGCGSDDPTQPAPYLADTFGEHRVVESATPMLVGDGAAGEVDAADREPGRGPLGEVGADQRGVGRQRGGAAGMAPSLPLAPGPVVHGAGGLGVGGGDGLGDADRLLDGQAGGQGGVIRAGCQDCVHPEVVRGDALVVPAGPTPVPPASRVGTVPGRPVGERSGEEAAGHTPTTPSLAGVSIKGALSGHSIKSLNAFRLGIRRFRA
jgi:hypothetical protein